MAATALVWLALYALVGGCCGVAAVYGARRDRDDLVRLLPGVPLAVAGVLELGMANGVVAATRPLNVLSGLAVLCAVVLGLVQWARRFGNAGYRA